ncbi:MAG: FAD-dependent oxidoreductase, partial [Planctomycetota bacterium]
MTDQDKNLSPLQLSERIHCLPVVNGSGDCALSIRKWLLEHQCDCLAVALPASFQTEVLAGVEQLPQPSIVLQRAAPSFSTSWTPETEQPDQEDEEGTQDAWSYVPIDPCQPMIMAMRVALGEHWPIKFCDLETGSFQPLATVMPDPYALRNVPLEKFATAMLSSMTRPFQTQTIQRLEHMAWSLKQMELKYSKIVFVCSILEWPWLHEIYHDRYVAENAEDKELPFHDSVEQPQRYSVRESSLAFMFGELPFITGLYEKARVQLEDDENLAIDGVKQLLMSARSSYRQDLGKRARKITPLLLTQCLKYIRNQSLLEHRMTPDLYTIAVSAQQILGDQYSIHLIDTARSYPFAEDTELPEVALGLDQLRLPESDGGETVSVVSRLPGQPMAWRSLELRRKPIKQEMDKWKTQWNPHSQCSWPPEDNLIESFRARVFDRAKALIGADLARSEKFSTSIKDGIDIRETLRHWYDGEIYVKVMPPSVGTMDCCVMLFDTPADPRDYPWRTTWHAEHQNESTLGFFATNFADEMIGPGIALATYGGAMFLFPPIPVPDIWQDGRLDFADSLEERIVGAACLHARESQIALLSPAPPTATFRKIARRFKKRLVHIPLSTFNDAMVQQMRMVHVLNGYQVRSYAEHFIRKAAGMGRGSYRRDPDSYEKRHSTVDVLVIGAGAAGLCAALAAGRSGAKVLVVEQDFALGGAL